MTQPTNIVAKKKSKSAQFLHYPDFASGASDFDKSSNAGASGNFLNESVNDGDLTTYDYVDLRKSMTSKYAKKIEIYIESSADTELFIRVNPNFVYAKRSLINSDEVRALEEEFNTGWKNQNLHRIPVPANTPITYTIEEPVVGFNIDYNGGVSGLGTHNIDKLIINCT